MEAKINMEEYHRTTIFLLEAIAKKIEQNTDMKKSFWVGVIKGQFLDSSGIRKTEIVGKLMLRINSSSRWYLSSKIPLLSQPIFELTDEHQISVRKTLVPAFYVWIMDMTQESGKNEDFYNIVNQDLAEMYNDMP